ncbi:MAG TPA: hypothetical protein VM597_23885 [Gemmataceae bacterium]|nr:hypothetical protein [Gemmataceae bacterium]
MSPNILPAEDGDTWAGQPARSVVFSGDWDGNQVKGQALAIAYQGYAYVFFAWAAERDWDGLKDELLGLKAKFHFLTPRADWSPRVGDTVTYDGPGYELVNPGDWVLGKPADQWKPKEKPRYVVDNVKDEDPAAVMALMAAYQSNTGGDTRRRPAAAYALIVELSKGGSPLEVAKDHVTDRIHREFGGKIDVKLEPAAGHVPLPTGGPAIGRFRFRSPLDKDDRTVWVISAISVGGKVVAVEIKTREQDATFVEEWMVQLAASLKAKQGT